MRKIFILFTILCSFFIFNANISFADTGSAADGNAITATSDIGTDNDLAIVLCNVLRFVTGGVGKTIASFIIIGVGVGFFTGKVSWGVLIGVTLGISAMFGAPAIVGAITGGSGSQLCGTTQKP